ncbi:MAG: zinc-binding dehydrogenase [Bacteroidales bacterium]|nr:zinc-binding dehydrogenase [Bacteroidales bacterium]
MSDKREYPEKMIAVFTEKQGGPLVVREVEIPKPGPGEVLVKIAAAPINPSDLARVRNMDTDLDKFIPGLEGSGTVVAAGKGLLPRLWFGKRVACTHHGIRGTWAEYMLTSAAMCFPLKNKVSFEQGSMTLVNPLTALAFMEIAEAGKHRAIINNAAASALGRMVELLAAKKGIPVINLVRNSEHVATLIKKGSKYVLNTSDPSFIETLGNLSNELHATLMFDSVCGKELPEMIKVLPPKSAVYIYGNLTGAEHINVNPRSLIDNNITVSGFFLGRRAGENGMIKNMKNLRQVGSLMSDDLTIKIQGRFPLTRAQEAVDTYLKNMSAGKVLLIPNQGKY